MARHDHQRHNYEHMSELNTYLSKVEPFLADLEVETRVDILSEISRENKNLTEFSDALEVANSKRKKYGIPSYRPLKKFSLFKFLFKLWLSFIILFAILISILYFKFSPLFEMSEDQTRITLLGGVVEIDAKAGKFKVMNQVDFTEPKYKNDFQGSITLTDVQDEIIVKFNSGAFTLSTSSNSDFTFDCKIEKSPRNNIIGQDKSEVQIDFTDMKGSSCSFTIPVDKKISLEGADANVDLIKPIFSSYIELENGNISITPDTETEYKYILEIENGYIGEFPSSESEDAYEIQAELESGSIVTR